MFAALDSWSFALGIVAGCACFGLGYSAACVYYRRRCSRIDQRFMEYFNNHTFYSGEAGPTEPPNTDGGASD